MIRNSNAFVNLIIPFAFRKPERQRFQEAFPDHRTVLLEGARHFIQEDEPGRIASEIRAFVH